MEAEVSRQMDERETSLRQDHSTALNSLKLTLEGEKNRLLDEQ